MRIKMSLAFLLVFFSILFSGCGNKENDVSLANTSYDSNNDKVKSAVNDSTNDYSSSFSDPTGETQAKISDKKEEVTPTIRTENSISQYSNIKETDLISLAKNSKLWSFDTWGSIEKIDYFGSTEIEAALNAGINLENKVVMCEVLEVHPDSSVGYNIWAGEHLNFITSNAGLSKIKPGDIMVLTVQGVESIDKGGYLSWFLYTDIFSKPSGSGNENSGYDSDDWSWLYDDPTPIPTEEPTNYTYESNQYFDVVETYTYQSGKYTYIVDKILGKATDKNIDLTMLIYDKNDEVVDKCTADVVVNNGYYNFIEYAIESPDYDHHTVSYTASSNWDTGDPDPVKMVKYSIKGKKLLITFEQTGRTASFAKFKLLLFKKGKLVYAGSYYFNVYVKQLSGVGSIDVAELSFSQDYDSIEYYYDP